MLRNIAGNKRYNRHMLAKLLGKPALLGIRRVSGLWRSRIDKDFGSGCPRHIPVIFEAVKGTKTLG